MKLAKLTTQQTVDFALEQQTAGLVNLEFDRDKCKFLGFENLRKIFELRLPLPCSDIRTDESVDKYLERIAAESFPPYFVLLIQAGHAALGYFEGGKVFRHKALRAYMVRKGQGKSQLSFSKNGKGKSSGSQLRHQNAIHFFEDINHTLNEWNVMKRCERILYSCPISLWSYLFSSKIKCPFDKKDLRLQKIPLDVRVPNYEELIRVNKIISFGYLTHFPVQCNNQDNFCETVSHSL